MYKRIESEDFYDLLVENTQIPRAVVIQAVSAISKTITNFVLNGHAVEIAGLGRFSAKCSSKGVATKKEASALQLKKLSLRFTPCARLKAAAESVTFNKIVESSKS